MEMNGKKKIIKNPGWKWKSELLMEFFLGIMALYLMIFEKIINVSSVKVVIGIVLFIMSVTSIFITLKNNDIMRSIKKKHEPRLIVRKIKGHIEINKSKIDAICSFENRTKNTVRITNVYIVMIKCKRKIFSRQYLCKELLFEENDIKLVPGAIENVRLLTKLGENEHIYYEKNGSNLLIFETENSKYSDLFELYEEEQILNKH